MIAWLREEPRRIWRGVRALQRVLGLQFTASLLLIFGLLLWAVLRFHGGLAFVLGLILVLLAIRAHDLGDEQEPEPTEFSTFWTGDQWTAAELAELERERAARAQVEFLRRRGSAELGPPHDPVEL